MDNQTNFDSVNEMQTNLGKSVAELSKEKPVMLFFLRHFGCTFCREALDEVSDLQPQIEEKGVQLVFVHMADNEIADRYFVKYKLRKPPHVSDPDCKYYLNFGILKGSITQLFGFHNWLNGFRASIAKGHGLSMNKQLGDDFQMPGIFLIKDGKIVGSHVHRFASERPDYMALASALSA